MRIHFNFKKLHPKNQSHYETRMDITPYYCIEINLMILFFDKTMLITTIWIIWQHTILFIPNRQQTERKEKKKGTVDSDDNVNNYLGDIVKRLT